jgi:hypothetical protein
VQIARPSWPLFQHDSGYSGHLYAENGIVRVTKSIIAKERATRTANEYDMKRCVDGVGDLIRIELSQIRKVGEFLQIPSERNCILFRSSRDVTSGVVELFET